MQHAADARHVALVVNTAARRGAEALAEAEALIGQARFERLSVHPVCSGSDLSDVIDEALAEGPDLLVVGGGDGTLSCAAGRLAGTTTVLGVLPLGTANDFARTLQIPTEVGAAVTALVAGRVVAVDLGRINSSDAQRAFLNVASIGLSTGVTEKLTPRLKQRLGPLAYPLATLTAYRHHRPFAATLHFPDGDHADLRLDDLLQVAVGNGKHYGGGNAVSPTASLDDHLLDVYAIARGRLRDHVSIARLLRTGHFVEHERVTHLTTRRVRVSTDAGLPVNLDGELAARTPADFTVEHDAVRVVVPLTSDAVGLGSASATGRRAARTTRRRRAPAR